MYDSVCVCVCAWVRACVGASVRACVRAGVRTYVSKYLRMYVCMYSVCKGKGMFYIAQYPARWTAQSILHFWYDTFSLILTHTLLRVNV